MNATTIRLLKRLRHLRKRLPGRNKAFGMSYEDAAISGQAAADLIASRLRDNAPLMVCRFGSVELHCLLNDLAIRAKASLLKKSWDYVGQQAEAFWWDPEIVAQMSTNAGFFPTSPELLQRFSALMLESIEEVDILGTWLVEEHLLADRLTHVTKVPLPDLEPYYHANPWSEALADRKVLVVHPFETSIVSQFKKRALLFDDDRVLPRFTLRTVKAVQSIADSTTAHATWFDAYESMVRRIEDTDFDVAILGCGAYGFPLAAHVKRMGKKAVHLGGATQILFGIKGKRWEAHPQISKFMNAHWVRPLAEEMPTGHARVEGGAYW